MTAASLYANSTAQATVDGLRCWKCTRLLAELVTRPYKIKCARCKAVNAA